MTEEQERVMTVLGPIMSNQEFLTNMSFLLQVAQKLYAPYVEVEPKDFATLIDLIPTENLEPKTVFLVQDEFQDNHGVFESKTLAQAYIDTKPENALASRRSDFSITEFILNAPNKS